VSGPAQDGGPRRLAVVLAGAGARGAYEAGVLSVVLPHLAAQGQQPDLYVGTSAGALNAAFLASVADLPAEDQADALLEVWRGIGAADVFRPLARTVGPTAGRWLGQLFGLPGVRLFGLVDTAPLRRTATNRVNWEQLRANVSAGLVSLAVVTTASATERTVVFVDSPSGDVPPSDDDRPIDYVATPITVDHLLASAAIPVFFPAVRVTEPAGSAGWYMDGGVRLNAPLKPALALGADALVVVATHPDKQAGGTVPPGSPQQPDVDDALVQIMDATLVDRMVEDLRNLARLNDLVGQGAQLTSGRPLKVVPWMFFGPAERGTVGALAAATMQRWFSGPAATWRALRHPDLPVLGRLLGGDGPRRGDLMSYLLFDRDFVDAAIEQGRRDATDVLAGSDPGDLLRVGSGDT
jgi:NTE family protein